MNKTKSDRESIMDGSFFTETKLKDSSLLLEDDW